MLSLVNPKLVLGAAAVAAVVGAFIYVYNEGKDAGAKDIVVEIEKQKADSVAEKEKIDEEVRELDDDQLLERALGAVRASD